MHTLIAVHQTPFSPVKLARAGIGVRCSDHFLPFQRSTNGSPEHGS
jgi:hypothetical protein